MSAPRRATLLQRFAEVRQFTEALCRPLAPEDCVIQSMPDVSPTRWHLAHTTWFFETFVLSVAGADYRPFHADFAYLFNSYYNSVGEQFPRGRRGLLSRPTVAEVYDYRRWVDGGVRLLLGQEGPADEALLDVIELGLQHEQQHQELILTDILHVLSCNPLGPVYAESRPSSAGGVAAPQWVRFPEGLRSIGHAGPGFAFDNEAPRHRVFVEAFALANRPTTNRDYLAFVEAGGYRQPELWLSAGWHQVRAEGWRAPLHWVERPDGWHQFTLGGLRPLDLNAPVCHVSYFEADAFARWSDARLPTEAEWETAAAGLAVDGNFAEDGWLRPVAGGVTPTAPVLRQLYGDVWEWTASPYTPYPGFVANAGALGEYNGKFMCNQYVLRGGSCATPRSHIRATYRNFFPPDARWQFSGIRLAKDVRGPSAGT